MEMIVVFRQDLDQHFGRFQLRALPSRADCRLIKKQANSVFVEVTNPALMARALLLATGKGAAASCPPRPSISLNQAMKRRASRKAFRATASSL